MNQDIAALPPKHYHLHRHHHNDNNNNNKAERDGATSLDKAKHVRIPSYLRATVSSSNRAETTKLSRSRTNLQTNLKGSNSTKKLLDSRTPNNNIGRSRDSSRKDINITMRKHAKPKSSASSLNSTKTIHSHALKYKGSSSKLSTSQDQEEEEEEEEEDEEEAIQNSLKSYSTHDLDITESLRKHIPSEFINVDDSTFSLPKSSTTSSLHSLMTKNVSSSNSSSKPKALLNAKIAIKRSPIGQYNITPNRNVFNDHDDSINPISPSRIRAPSIGLKKSDSSIGMTAMDKNGHLKRSQLDGASPRQQKSNHKPSNSKLAKSASSFDEYKNQRRANSLEKPLLQAPKVNVPNSAKKAIGSVTPTRQPRDIDMKPKTISHSQSLSYLTPKSHQKINIRRTPEEEDTFIKLKKSKIPQFADEVSSTQIDLDMDMDISFLKEYSFDTGVSNLFDDLNIDGLGGANIPSSIPEHSSQEKPLLPKPPKVSPNNTALNFKNQTVMDNVTAYYEDGESEITCLNLGMDKLKNLKLEISNIAGASSDLQETRTAPVSNTTKNTTQTVNISQFTNSMQKDETFESRSCLNLGLDSSAHHFFESKNSGHHHSTVMKSIENRKSSIIKESQKVDAKSKNGNDWALKKRKNGTLNHSNRPKNASIPSTKKSLNDSRPIQLKKSATLKPKNTKSISNIAKNIGTNDSDSKTSTSPRGAGKRMIQSIRRGRSNHSSLLNNKDEKIGCAKELFFALKNCRDTKDVIKGWLDNHISDYEEDLQQYKAPVGISNGIRKSTSVTLDNVASHGSKNSAHNLHRSVSSVNNKKLGLSSNDLAKTRDRSSKADACGPVSKEAISSNAGIAAQDLIQNQPFRHRSLNVYERGELSRKDLVHYLRLSDNAQITIQISNFKQNFGFDDSQRNYIALVGDHVDYRYEILQVLGRGSFGNVLRCKDHKSGKIVAIKVIKNDMQWSLQAVYEIKVLKNLNDGITDKEDHGILKYIDHFNFRSHMCIVTELLSVDLFQTIQASQFQGMSVPLVMTWTHQIFEALKFIHSHNIIHCDLKPENIMLYRPDRLDIKLIDFGSACYVNETSYSYIQSRYYRSPEVLLGARYATAIDIWSAGCIVGELVRGDPIFAGNNEKEQLAMWIELLGAPKRRTIVKLREELLKKGPIDKQEAAGPPYTLIETSFDKLGQLRSGALIPNGKKRYVANSKTLQEVIFSHGKSIGRSKLELLLAQMIQSCLNWDPFNRVSAPEVLESGLMKYYKANKEKFDEVVYRTRNNNFQ
ncbi:hypothetical protein DASC09_036450 [Saccharomycopsis crataegensis]|uniref:Protein kinase domain-containing protein n=1 Tax=Saccharomycopsis crataegensis TaxID=43959 RepID=A0AAV5QPU1_9ASCO|nr:hypothetical protein DASC09_036450 [Saccharomycopsis crataegensis]